MMPFTLFMLLYPLVPLAYARWAPATDARAERWEAAYHLAVYLAVGTILCIEGLT